METKEFDYIVVGAGSAGCVVANQLSADPDCRVLVLEAGGRDRNFWLRLPVGYYRTIANPRFTRTFMTEPCQGTAGRAIPWPRGRVIGGSSSINGLVFIRGQSDGFDDWARLGAKGWDFESLLPHFRRIEKNAGKPDQWRGDHGNLAVSNLRNRNPACEAWLEAAQSSGLPANPDFNGESTFGVGRFQLTIGSRWRESAAAAFLRPAQDRKNLTVETHATVGRVLCRGNVATGVEWHRGGETYVSQANAEVILACGAIQSPQILQLSGIGPASLLKRFDIPLVADLPGVGENLQDHYQIRTILRLRDKISLNDTTRNPLKLAGMGIEWLLKGSGPLTVGAVQVGGGACTDQAEGNRPDVQIIVMPFSVDRPGLPLHDYSGFTVAVWQCHPRARGRVRITSTDPQAPPRIEPNYLADERDRKSVVAGLKLVRNIAAQPPFRDLWEEEMLPGKAVTTDEDLLEFARNNGSTVFHCSGSCRMGEDDEAVVDSRLRVRGVDRLRVIDASIMPEVTSANTNAACLMIGDKGAHMILEDSAGSDLPQPEASR